MYEYSNLLWIIMYEYSNLLWNIMYEYSYLVCNIMYEYSYLLWNIMYEYSYLLCNIMYEYSFYFRYEKLANESNESLHPTKLTANRENIFALCFNFFCLFLYNVIYIAVEEKWRTT